MLRQKEPLASRLISKNDQILKLFGRDQQLLATYPATVGSTEKPAPSGRLKITGISRNPTYRYDPKYEFKGVRATKPFTIKPGPNSPVGLVWIGLSREGYGIHGTPDPSKVSKTASHGCIRLTNWDALSVASAVARGTGTPTLDAALGRTAMQIEKHDKSYIVKLEDGSSWRIWPGDIALTLGWSSITVFEVSEIDDEFCSHALVDKTGGSRVRVIEASKDWPVQKVRQSMKKG
jgi:hypothetical protein